MDPATAVALWLLTDVVLPDAYQRIASEVSSGTSVRRLIREVRSNTGLRIGLGYRRWLRKKETWTDLVSRDNVAYERMVDRLTKAEARGILRSRSEDRERAEKLVGATIAHFLPTLDPSTAVAISDLRSERRHIELLDRFDARAGFEERLQSLPPSARAMLEADDDHRALIERLVDGLVRNEPRQIISAWYKERPSWLGDAPGSVILAFGSVAQSYGFREEAGHLYEESADLGIDPAYWYARAALEAHAAGQADRQAEMLRSARAAGGGSFVEFLAAAIEEEWDSAVAAMTEDKALEDPLTGPLYAIVIGNTESPDAEVNLLSRVIERHPEYTNARLRLAHLLLARSRSPETTSRDLDLQRALDLALEARDLLRAWKGESGEAVELASRAAVLGGQMDLTIRIGTAVPDGEALPEESARPEVQFNVAQAAMASGNHALAERVAHAGTGFHHALLQAEILALRGAPSTEITDQYEVAWSQIEDEQDKVTYWLSASSNGVDPLSGLDELDQRSDELPTICRACQSIAQGRVQEAIDLLRPQRTSEMARQLLTTAYMQNNDIDAAISELLDMAQRFANSRHRVRAVELLLGANRIPEASDLAADTLALLPVGRRERNLLHETLVAAAHNRHDWRDMETRARAWIAEAVGDCRLRWLLVLAIYNQGEPERAWRILQESEEDCGPESELEAQLWMTLHARFSPSTSALSSILAVVDRFPADPDVRRVAVNSFFLMGEEKGAIDEPELARWHQLIQDRADSPEPDDTFVSIAVPDDAEALAEAFRPILEDHARRVDEWVRKVSKEGWPYGMISLAAGRIYAETLVHRPTGFLPISFADPRALEIEAEIAGAAIDEGSVVIDTSSVVVASYLRDSWSVFLSAFRIVEVTASCRLDAAMAADDWRPKSNETLAWDLQSDQPVRHITDQATLDRIESQLRWVRDQVFALSVSSEGTDPEPVDAEQGENWISAFRAARATSRPLWADDVGLRVLARNEGVQAFGTQALLHALAARGILAPDVVEDGITVLRNEYCVDLTFTRSWLLGSASDSDWRPGPAWLVMSRPAVWMQPAEAFEHWSAIAEAAVDSDPAKLVPWVYAAVQGIGSVPNQLDRKERLAAGVLVKAATLIAFEPSQFSEYVLAASAAASETETPDPTGMALGMTMAYLSQELGAARAASVTAVLGSELGDEHRRALRRILFDV